MLRGGKVVLCIGEVFEKKKKKQKIAFFLNKEEIKNHPKCIFV